MVRQAQVPLIGHVTLPPLADNRDAQLWPALLDLADNLPQPYTVIGGMMVWMHGAVAGQQPPRVTQDIDVLMDLRAQVSALRKAVTALERLGYRVDGMSPDGLAHRYRRDDGTLVDLLAPDNLGRRADLTTTPPGRTLEVPGGTKALSHRVAVEIRYGTRSSVLYLPELARALHCKVKAYLIDHPTPRPGIESRHLSDIAFLVSLIDDPDRILEQLGARPGCEHFTAAAVLDDPRHPAWLTLGARADDARLVWGQLRHG
ncbi:hypothetical protein [Nocardia sp. XZ_19_385]|uniref:hypothetical protein n=1 Tax=Nocardia sp. XZ_19_385 TaxID=2769488 RepID=UPI001890537E|nr:hypothetical protein [Nocardia sp. XZ_19_385]